MTRNYALGDPCVQLWTFGMFCVSLQTGQSADEDLFFTRSGWLCAADLFLNGYFVEIRQN